MKVDTLSIKWIIIVFLLWGTTLAVGLAIGKSRNQRERAWILSSAAFVPVICLVGYLLGFPPCSAYTREFSILVLCGFFGLLALHVLQVALISNVRARLVGYAMMSTIAYVYVGLSLLVTVGCQAVL
jgi:hypothetical protein